MSFLQVLLIITGLLITIIIIVSLVLLFYRKLRFAVSFAVGHCIFILLILIGFEASRQEAQSQLFWIVPAIIDLPSSLILLAVKPSGLRVGGVSVVLVTIGTAQYYLLGKFIDWCLTKRRNCYRPNCDRKRRPN